MDIFKLPDDLWNKVFGYVLNSRDSSLADLLAASVFQPQFAIFELKSLEFLATDDNEVVKIGINRRQPMDVHLAELELARETLLPFLHKTTHFTIVGANKNHKWLDALMWAEASEVIERLIIVDCEINDFLLQFVAKSYARNAAFIKCTAMKEFSCKISWHTKSLLIYECSPIFVARVAEMAIYPTTDLQQLEVHMNFLDERIDLNRIKFEEIAARAPKEQRFDFELNYWRRISQIINSIPEITVAFYVKDGDLQLAFMLLVFYRNGLLDYQEYEIASSTLKLSTSSTVAFGRIFKMRRLFVNSLCCSPPKDDLLTRFEAHYYLEKHRQMTEYPSSSSDSQTSIESIHKHAGGSKRNRASHKTPTVVQNSVSLVA